MTASLLAAERSRTEVIGAETLTGLSGIEAALASLATMVASLGSLWLLRLFSPDHMISRMAGRVLGVQSHRGQGTDE